MNEILPYAKKWMALDINRLSGVSQAEKDKHHIIYLCVGSKKTD